MATKTAKKAAGTTAAPGVGAGIASTRVADRAEPVAPYKARGGGCCATGTVSEVRNHPEGGANVRVTVRHGAGKKAGEYEPYMSGAETAFHIPAHLAKRFPHGSKVSIHVKPHGAAGGGKAIDDADRAGQSGSAEVVDASEDKISKAYEKAGKKA